MIDKKINAMNNHGRAASGISTVLGEKAVTASRMVAISSSYFSRKRVSAGICFFDLI